MTCNALLCVRLFRAIWFGMLTLSRIIIILAKNKCCGADCGCMTPILQGDHLKGLHDSQARTLSASWHIHCLAQRDRCCNPAARKRLNRFLHALHQSHTPQQLYLAAAKRSFVAVVLGRWRPSLLCHLSRAAQAPGSCHNAQSPRQHDRGKSEVGDQELRQLTRTGD